MICGAVDCGLESAVSWQRWASAEELAELKRQHKIPQNARSAQLMVYACEDHQLTPDLMAMTHLAPCTAPPVCTCGF